MKGLILAFTILISSAAFAGDRVSTAVKTTLDKGVQIFAIKSTDARNSQMCALMKGSLSSATIGPNLLGQYAITSTDQKGVKLFIKEIPSFITSQLISRISSTAGTQIDVADNSYDRGNGSFEVAITIHTANGNAYSGKAIVAAIGKSLRLIDVEYMGFSAVQYMGNDIQKKIGDEEASDPDHPVMSFTKKQMADPAFIQCN